MNALPDTTALAPWFGSDRLVVKRVGVELEGIPWVGIPFAGGCSAALYITARSLAINDLHPHMMNMAAIARDPVLGPKLYRAARREMFCDQTLKAAQKRCRQRIQDGDHDPLFGRPLLPRSWDGGALENPNLQWALDYWICCWMSRSGGATGAGTANEFSNGLSVRWEAGGGDSVTRYHSATRSLIAWRRLLQRATVHCGDAFDFIANVKDDPKRGFYIDAPWPDKGESYLHSFTEKQQRKLASVLGAYRQARIIIRYGDHPLIRELYPEIHWRWIMQLGRAQSNDGINEVLIVNRAVEEAA